MFKKPELIKFDFEEEEWFYYVITDTEEYIDMSIFSTEEWERLVEIDKKFRMEQSGLQDLSDDSYSWMFNKDNPKYKKNCEFREVVYYLDRGLEGEFGVKFRDLEPTNEARSKLQLKYEELHWKTMDEGSKDCTKDKLRKWFIDHYKTLEEYFNNIFDL